MPSYFDFAAWNTIIQSWITSHVLEGVWEGDRTSKRAMHDLKRKSDKAELDHDSNNDGQSGHDDQGIKRRKEWLLGEVESMEKAYKLACVRRAKIMQYYADILERDLHHVHPRAPRFLVIGYQNACKEWERLRRRVAAYTSRAAEIYTEPREEPINKPEGNGALKPEPIQHSQASTANQNQNKAQGYTEQEVNSCLGGSGHEQKPVVSSQRELAGITTLSTAADQTRIPPLNDSTNVLTPSSAAQPINMTGLLPSVDILPNFETFPIQNAPNLPPNTLDTFDHPKLDAKEMALFDFINSVANSPTADGPGHDTNMNMSSSGMLGMYTDAGTGEGSGAGTAGIDFGLLEAGLRDGSREEKQTFGGVDTGLTNTLEYGASSAPQPSNIGSGMVSSASANFDANSASLGNGTMDESSASLDLFSQYPAIFNIPDSGFPSNNVAGGETNTGGDFDPSTFDYSSINMDAFFADGIPSMEGT